MKLFNIQDTLVHFTAEVATDTGSLLHFLYCLPTNVLPNVRV